MIRFYKLFAEDPLSDLFHKYANISRKSSKPEFYLENNWFSRGIAREIFLRKEFLLFFKSKLREMRKKKKSRPIVAFVQKKLLFH